MGVVTFQAEDEIRRDRRRVGAAYAGTLGVTSSSGPGMALKTEMLGLAIATELPLVVIDSQRAGPSTGMPTRPSSRMFSVPRPQCRLALAVVAAATAATASRSPVEACASPRST